MKKSNWEMPVSKLTRVRDFLPSPQRLRLIRAKTHEEVLKPFLKDERFRKGYEAELKKLRAQQKPRTISHGAID